MLRMFRGDKSFLPENLGPPSHIVVSCESLVMFITRITDTVVKRHAHARVLENGGKKCPPNQWQ
jgi:hypothetical protein